MICPECGREVDDNSVACPNCGYPLEELKSAAVNFDGNQEDERKNDKQQTGEETENMQSVHTGYLMRCPECGKDVYSEDEVCGNCGFGIRNFVEKKNKRKLSDIIDDFSMDAVNDYIDYVVHKARNTIKLLTIGLLVDVIAFFVGIINTIFNVKSLVSTLSRFADAKAAAVAGSGGDINQVISTYHSMEVKDIISLCISVVLTVCFVVIAVKIVKALIDDYE